MKKITVWRLWSKGKEQFIHNHIEDGHSDALTPAIGSRQQQVAWWGKQWERRYAMLTDDYRVVYPETN